MKIGIWTQNTSLANMQKLYNMGFRGAPIGATAGGTWNNAVERMYDFYSNLKQIGYTHFLLQMRSESTEYQDKVIAKFKYCQDVEYLCGEPYELVEKCGWDEEKMYDMLADIAVELLLLKPSKSLLIDIQLRLWDKIGTKSKVPSSYFWQQRVWYKGQPFCWIYGQLTWHSFIPFFGSSSYKRLKREMDKKGIAVAYLYQGDEGWFCNLLNNFFLKRFVNTMGEK